MSEVYNLLETSKYTLKQNSTFSGYIPSFPELGYVPVALSPIFRRGTYGTTREKIIGNASVAIISGNIISFSYNPKTDFIGDDSLEFMIEYYNDVTGTRMKKLKIVELDIVKSFQDINIKNKYREIYLQGADNIDCSFVPQFSPANSTPTKITISISDSGLSIENNIKMMNNGIFKGASIVSSTKTKIKFQAENNLYITDEGNKVVGLDKTDMTIIRTLPHDREDYFIIRFRDFVDKNTGLTVPYEESVYIIFHARQVNDIPVSNIIKVPEYLIHTTPSFEQTDINFPMLPDNKSFDYSTVFAEGDLLENTKPHKDFDKYNNRTIRLGKNVPDGAVNLGYYYNAISSFNDTISIQETNTNIVNLKYAEDWLSLNNCPSKDENQFPKSIFFEGKEGTQLEGYYGTLYREFVDWDEKLDIDQEPEAATMYEEFRGTQRPRVPLNKKYDDGYKSGELTLTHKICTAIDFTRRDIYSLYTNNGRLPRQWLIQAKYEGIVSRNIILYNGTAKYSGIVSKKDGMSNIDPEQDKELKLYPDENGVLYTLDGKNLLDDELFYITDKFKDDCPLYYKHRLSYRVYNSIGKDQYGNYEMDGIKLVNESGNSISNKYKYKIVLKETQWNDIYDAYVYTNFVPSPSMPIYAMYNGMAQDAYVGALNISPLNVKVGILEKLSVVQAMDTDEYVVKTVQGLTQQNTITMNNFEVMYDKRNKLKIQYVITAAGLKTPPIEVEVINKKYALYSELDRFRDDEMIVSEENTAGYLTAKEMLIKYAGEENRKKIEAAKVVKVGFNLDDLTNTFINKEKVMLYTDPDGTGLIYAKTYCDTGLLDEEGTYKYNKTLDPDCIYREKNGRIYKGYSVLCRNINKIVISAPDETNPLKGWYPKIKYSYFNKVYERMDESMQLIYSIPEFHSQIYGAYGEPYKDVINEVPKFVGNNTVKTIHYPLYIKMNSNNYPENIKAYITLADGSQKLLNVDNFNFKYGYITFKEKISDNDNIFISYTYEEQYYHYKGYYGNQDETTKMINMNINPSMYSTYTDTENELKDYQQTYNLFNKTVYFFLRPMRIINTRTGAVEKDNKFTMYHRLNNQESEGPFDLLIGRIFVRHHASQKSTVLLDTRRRGGGIIEAMADEMRRELESDSDFYLDIGTLDGKPYQENSVIVIRLDKKILKINGGNFTEEDVKNAIYKWSAMGMYPIIEYVDIVSEEDMPMNTIKVNKHIENQSRYNPYIQIEITDR